MASMKTPMKPTEVSARDLGSTAAPTYAERKKKIGGKNLNVWMEQSYVEAIERLRKKWGLEDQTDTVKRAIELADKGR